MASFGLQPLTLKSPNGQRLASISNAGITSYGGGTNFISAASNGGRASAPAAGGFRGTLARPGVGAGAGGAGGYAGLAGGAGGAAGQSLTDLLAAANKANEARYNESKGLIQTGGAEQMSALTSGYEGLKSQVAANKQEQMGLVGKIGGAARERETQRTTRELASGQQSLVGRGLGNSTVVDSVRRGVMDDSALRGRELDEADAGRQLGVAQHNGDQGLSIGQAGLTATNALMGSNRREMTDLIGSKVDQGPNLANYANLASQAGAMGGNPYQRTATGQAPNSATQNALTALQQQYQQGQAGQQQQQPGETMAQWRARQTAINNRIGYGQLQKANPGDDLFGGLTEQQWQNAEQYGDPYYKAPYDAGHATGSASTSFTADDGAVYYYDRGTVYDSDGNVVQGFPTTGGGY